MRRVHRHLYSKDVERMASYVTFLRRLCEDLSSILGKPIAVHGDEGA